MASVIKTATLEKPKTALEALNQLRSAANDEAAKTSAVAAVVDKLGETRALLAPLKQDEELLTKELRPLLETDVPFLASFYEALKSATHPKVVDNAKLIKKIGQKQFNAIAKISLKDLEEILGKADIDAITKEGANEIVSIRTKAIKKIKD